MKPTYYDCWDDHAALNRDYPDVKPEEVVYAGYTYEDYSGDALVVFVRDGKLFENNDGHCSCNGLDCWRPEETNVAVLKMRKGWPGLHEALDANAAFLPSTEVIQ